MKTAIRLVERGVVPKPLVRHGIRRLLRERAAEERARHLPDRDAALRAWVREMDGSPVALVPDLANEQHYEVPAEFYELVLGRRLKYSSGYYPDAFTTLDEAEEAMLALTAERAGLADGQRILELGCGWGSLTLWMAEQFPNSSILAVSNSASQRRSILDRARERGLENLSVVTYDMNEFDTPVAAQWLREGDSAEDGGEGQAVFDRIVSVEMFEHMRNWRELLRRASRWLAPDGRLFLHVFAHQRWAYPFEVRDESDWMSRYFFSGGMMPSHDLVDFLDVPFEVEQRWVVPGTHYARTSEDWVRNLERNRAAVLALFRATYGPDQASLWFQRWRLFFLACAELFAFEGGDEWIVSHQLLRPTEQASPSEVVHAGAVTP